MIVEGRALSRTHPFRSTPAQWHASVSPARALRPGAVRRRGCGVVVQSMGGLAGTRVNLPRAGRGGTWGRAGGEGPLAGGRGLLNVVELRRLWVESLEDQDEEVGGKMTNGRLSIASHPRDSASFKQNLGAYQYGLGDWELDSSPPALIHHQLSRDHGLMQHLSPRIIATQRQTPVRVPALLVHLPGVSRDCPSGHEGLVPPDL